MVTVFWLHVDGNFHARGEKHFSDMGVLVGYSLFFGVVALDDLLALRPFLPAQDFALSKRFYGALGFSLTHEDNHTAGLKLGRFSFILQNFYVKEFAENCMVQLMVRDADAWWAALDTAALVQKFGVKPPAAPTLQSWGMKVGFIFDPSGVLWHIAEAPF